MTGRRGIDRSREDGTVLLLTIGLSVVLMLLVAVVVDVSKVVLAQRALASAADGAAVLAAQQPDVQAVGGGLGERLALDAALVSDAVERYEAEAALEQRGLELDGQVDPADPSLAVVTATRTVRLPFAGWLGVTDWDVRAVARARSPVSP